ncbi:Hypothetical protein Minf_0709 [Methylacidiphilum infernorum V4]|uniref:Uncharacterized protein n=1 Tax=Methylacidiphilum infernorum (isolate V4) TaxID=481448 RepID=B3E0L0_METI4|nr:Hypothetical protein Minf_0709 [Methylacidiphilum infernorum V4]
MSQKYRIVLTINKKFSNGKRENGFKKVFSVIYPFDTLKKRTREEKKFP